jgi:septal ring factor EnvC (AmiA/AmiB activator)
MSRRTLYHRWHSASLGEVLQAIARIAAAYETQLTGERQTRLQERAAVQVQMKALQKERARERTNLKRQLATRSNMLERVVGVLRTVGARGAGLERTSEQPRREIERLTRENQALREEIARLKTTPTERAQEPSDVPVIRRVKRLITLKEDDPGRGGEDRLG